MKNNITETLSKEEFYRDEIIALLMSAGKDRSLLFKQSIEIKEEEVLTLET